jgi:hypothetical protein
MRKLSIAVLAIAALATVVSVAFAANTYEVHKASTTAKGKGSKAKPIPTGLTLGFKVEETDSSKRATVIEKYSLGSEGLIANGKATATCAFTQLDDQAGVPASCNKALVGEGLVKNAGGSNTDQSLATSLPCNLKVRLYNIGTGLAIRLDYQGKPTPPNFESDEIGCPLPIATAIKAKFVKTKIGGLPATDLRFSVQDNLRHPLVGTDNSLRESVTKIFLKTKKIKGKKVGLYNKVGCKGGKRLTRATFTTERTASQAPQTFTALKQTKC